MDTCRQIAAVEGVDEATYGLCGFPIKEDNCLAHRRRVKDDYFLYPR